MYHFVTKIRLRKDYSLELNTFKIENTLLRILKSNMLFKRNTLESYFNAYRKNIIGINQSISTPYHKSIPILYADWTASGRAYSKIEERLQKELLPYLANTHTETSDTGMYMTHAYHVAKEHIKNHVNANENDVLINCGSGMTGAVNKLQRIMAFKLHENYKSQIEFSEIDRPVVFVSHLEHHSNHTSWLETIADVEIIKPCAKGVFSVEDLKEKLQRYKNRKLKIVSVSSCSNVTGVITPVMDIAAIAHENNALCFADYACSAPYVSMNMHEDDAKGRYLDALIFSPHKFLGGPGSSGVLLFNKKLYHNHIPDHPGGGTVKFTDPWEGRSYLDNIEEREDGGTPAFLQTIRTALSIKLKEEMGVKNILDREEEILQLFFKTLNNHKGITVYEKHNMHRLGVVSLNIKGMHHQLAVRILNDRFGIQSRGGCSCAGTYGHYLLGFNKEESFKIQNQVNCGINDTKPGWVRVSFHPTFSNKEVVFLAKALMDITENGETYAKDYIFENGKYTHKSLMSKTTNPLKSKVDLSFTSTFK